MKRVFGAIAAVTVFTLATPLSASAQAIEEQAIEEIVVTAQKRAEHLRRVPVALTAYTGSQLIRSEIHTLQKLAQLTPSFDVQTNNSPVTQNYRIRRVGNLGNIPTFEPAVGVYIDGAYRPSPVFGAAHFLDIERVEIQRGPQSSLHGKNTTAGLVSLHSKKPENMFAASGAVTYGMLNGEARDADLFRTQLSVSLPVSDEFSIALAGAAQAHDATAVSALENSGRKLNASERHAFKGQWLWEPGGALQVRGLYNHTNINNAREQVAETYFDPDGFIVNDALPLWQAAGVSDVCTDNDPGNRKTCHFAENISDATTHDATLLARYTLANGLILNSLTSWDTMHFEGTHLDVVQMLAPLGIYQDTYDSESWQQELRLSSSNTDKHPWLIGVFLYQNRFDRGDDGQRPVFLGDTASDHPAVAAFNQNLLGTPFPVPFATQGQEGYLDSTQKTRYAGVFGQTTLQLGEQFKLRVAARWQAEEKRAAILQSVNDATPSIVSVLLSPSEVSGTGLKRSTDKLTWSLTPEWTTKKDALIYGTVSRGFKSGGFNTGFGSLPIATREFSDEDVTHYEIGYKATALNGGASVSAAAFFTQFKNYQDAAFVGSQFTVGNAESVELKGFEVESRFALPRNFSVLGSVTYTDLVYEKNTVGQCYPGRTPDSVTDASACDLSGEHPINAPKWSALISVSHQTDLGQAKLQSQLDWSWIDQYNTSFSADSALQQDAYHWINFNTSIVWRHLRLTAWVDNLLDRAISNADGVMNIYTGDNSFQRFLKPPRSVGLSLHWNYSGQ